jgi:hypothetical protein
MSLKAEQHSQIAAAYEKAAADGSLAAETRAAFARKADWFRLLAPQVSRRRLRIFLANRAIALGWALKGSCKAGAYRLVATARWLAPEAEGFLLLRTSSHNQNRRILLAAHLGTLHVQPLRVAAGGLIVLVLLGSLDLAKRATAITSQPKLSESTRQWLSKKVLGTSGSLELRPPWFWSLKRHRPVKSLQTKLQTNCAAQHGIKHHRMRWTT